MKMLSFLKNERGFILMTTYMLASTLMLFSIALFVRGSVFVQSSERNVKKIIAFNAAEAGFDDAFYRLKNNQISSFPWTSSYVSLDSGNMRGGYSTTVTNMGNNIYQIATTGYSPTQSSTTEILESRSVNSYVAWSNATIGFDYGIFAKQSIQMTGNATVDAYNSDTGAYGGGNVINNADVAATNSTGAATFSLDGNTIINGNVYVGSGGNPATVITESGSADITGASGAQSSNLSLATPSTAVASSGALSISGNTNYQLPAGTYNFSSLSITGNGRLTPLGVVNIYVSGTVNIAGNGIATVNSKPTNLTLYSTGTSTVSLSGNGNFYGGIYAPNSTVSNTGNGVFYGAVVANAYSQTGNGNVHFDQALTSDDGSQSSATQVLSWQETNKAAAY